MLDLLKIKHKRFCFKYSSRIKAERADAGKMVMFVLGLTFFSVLMSKAHANRQD